MYNLGRLSNDSCCRQGMIPFLFSFGVTAQIILMPWKVSYTSVVVILWTTLLGDNCRDIMDDIIGRQLSWYYGRHYWENTEKTLIHLHLVTAVNFYLEKKLHFFQFFQPCWMKSRTHDYNKNWSKTWIQILVHLSS